MYTVMMQHRSLCLSWKKVKKKKKWNVHCVASANARRPVQENRLPEDQQRKWEQILAW